MNISIRKFLLINLLLAITITTTITVVGNYYLDQKDIQSHLDTLLATSTVAYQSLLGDDTQNLNIQEVQQSLNHFSAHMEKYALRGLISDLEVDYAREYNFQVWGDSGKLLLRSPNAPQTPLSNGTEGFSDEHIEKDLWRVFTTYNPNAGTTIMVGERYDSRNRLGRLIARDDIYIMLLTFPLSGLLIWFIIGRGLASLNRVAKEVSDRAPTYLEPVEERGVPIEIKPVIQELNKLFFKLQQAFGREKRFAADAAHELRTPLAAMKTQAQVALNTQDEQERRAVLEKLIEGVNRSTHIIQQLLTMSRLVPEATYIDKANKVDLEKLAQEIIAQMVPSAIEKNIEIELICNSKKREISGNATALSILMRNLIDNAIRYTPDGGSVSVEISSDQNNVIFSVRDTGPGIPDELRERVFERFFRVLGNKAPGSGLGLAIVNQIANLHHATIKLEHPVQGDGLVVLVMFPRRGSQVD